MTTTELSSSSQLLVVGIILILILVSVLANNRANDEQFRELIDEKFDNFEKIAALSNVNAFHRALGRRDWFKADLIFTPDSICVFGGGARFVLNAQFYPEHSSVPVKIVSLDKWVIATDAISLDHDDLVINYVSPHWYKANCTLVLKDVMERKEATLIKEALIEWYKIDRL